MKTPPVISGKFALVGAVAAAVAVVGLGLTQLHYGRGEQVVRVGALAALPTDASGQGYADKPMSALGRPTLAPGPIDTSGLANVELAKTAKAYRLSHDEARQRLTALAKALQVSCPEAITETETDLVVQGCSNTDPVSLSLTKSFPLRWSFQHGFWSGMTQCRPNPACAPNGPCTEQCFAHSGTTGQPIEPNGGGTGGTGGVVGAPAGSSIPAQAPSDSQKPIVQAPATLPPDQNPKGLIQLPPLDDASRLMMEETVKKLAAASGVEVGTVEADSSGHAYGELQIDSTPVLDSMINVYVSKLAVVSASGMLVDRNEIGEYPLVDRAALLERIKAGKFVLGGIRPLPAESASREGIAQPYGVPDTAPPKPDNGVEVALITRDDLLVPVFRLTPSQTIVEAVVDDLLEVVKSKPGSDPKPMPPQTDPGEGPGGKPLPTTEPQPPVMQPGPKPLP